MKQAKLIYNAIKCLDGTILESRHRWDCKTHVDGYNGTTCMVDGGLSYLRRSGAGYVELSLRYGDNHTIVRERFNWGGRGVNGDEPLTYIILKDIVPAHLDALITYTEGCRDHPEIHQVFIDELNWRKDNDVTND